MLNGMPRERSSPDVGRQPMQIEIPPTGALQPSCPALQSQRPCSRLGMMGGGQSNYKAQWWLPRKEKPREVRMCVHAVIESARSSPLSMEGGSQETLSEAAGAHGKARRQVQK